MRAVRCHELVGPEGLRVDEMPDPEPGAGEIRIDVRAAGVNFPDVLITQGKYQFKPAPPFVPGGEVAGVVSAVRVFNGTLVSGARVRYLNAGANHDAEEIGVRTPDPTPVPALGRPFGPAQLRGASGDPDRGRAVRL